MTFMQLVWTFLACVALLFGSASELSACPFCDGGPSGINEVKAAIFGEDFAFNLLATSLPFLVLAGVVAFLSFGRPKPRRIAVAEPLVDSATGHDRESEGVTNERTV